MPDRRVVKPADSHNDTTKYGNVTANVHRALGIVLFRQYLDRDVGFFQTLTEGPWSARTFIVHDLDGNLVMFSAPGGQPA